MDEFTRSLKARVETALGHGSPWGEVNPLVVIGLTEAMLDLQLTEDQMYAAVHSYVRQLASQVHPDKKPLNVSEDRRRQIFSAFEVLDDRGNFSKALQEFRLLKADDRNEAKILREALRLARERLDSYQTKEVSLAQGRVELDRVRVALEDQEQLAKLVVPGLKGDIERLENLSSKARRSASYWKKKCEGINKYLSFLGADETNPLPGIHAFDAKWVVIASLVPRTAPLATPMTKSGRQTLGFRKALQHLEIPDTIMLEILARCAETIKTFGTPGPLESRHRVNLSLSVFQFQAGKPKALFGWEKAIGGGRIIGSIPPDRLKIGRDQLSRMLQRDSIFENLSPFLVPGGLLVSERIHKLVLIAPEKLHAFERFETKMVILGAG